MVTPSAPPPSRARAAAAAAPPSNEPTTASGPTPIVKDDYAVKLPHRLALREKNQRYWLEDAYKPKGPLDASLKKHTTLINKLRSALLTTSSDVLIKEIDGLTLTKYVEEIVGAVVEGLTAAKGVGKVDVDSIVEVISHLHARLTPEFLPLLLPELLDVLASSQPAPLSATDREKEEKERLARARVVLRVVAELALVGAWENVKGKAGKDGVKGVLNEQVGQEGVFERVKGLMSNDPTFSNIPLLITFLKTYKRTYLGGDEGTTTTTTASDQIAAAEAQELVPPSLQGKFRELFVAYFGVASKALVKGQTHGSPLRCVNWCVVVAEQKLLEQDKKNYEAYIKAGEIFEDRQNAYERMTRAVEKLQAGVQSLADLLNLTPPKLSTAASLAKSGLQIVNTASAFDKDGEDTAATGTGIWEDDEERKFYEDVLDLADDVPPTFLGAGVGGKTNGEQPSVVEDNAAVMLSPEMKHASAYSDAGDAVAEENGKSANGDTEGLGLEGANGNKAAAEEADDEVDPLQSGPAARLAAVFAALPEANNRVLIDKLAVDFTYLNSKAARKRCIKFLGSVPKNRTDLLPHYARFAAILNKYMPDIGAGLIAILDEEFRYLQRKKLVKELESVRLKNIRYYGELAKFKVAQPHTILHVLKVCLEDFTGPNVDNVANLLESCGRFLLRNEETSERAKAMVGLMRRKQNTQHFDARQKVMLENAYYQCNPPERAAITQVELSPMQSFIQHLVQDVLIKKTVDKVLKLVRKLHWEDPEVVDFSFKTFTEIWEVKFGNIPLVAMLVFDLQKYHPDFSLGVLDQILEEIRAGMEDNIFKHNQRRISTMKFFGELYMYRVVSTPVVFDTLWSLITFGHPEGLPLPGRSSMIDAADDYFRVRLVCTLLDTCGACFDRGSNKKKLDQFLIVFQAYVLCKAELPMDVEFMVSDTLEMLRPKMAPFKTFQDAAAAIDEMVAAQSVEGEAEEDEEEDDAESVGNNARMHGEDEDEEEDEDAAAEDDEGAPDARIDLSDDEDEEVRLIGSISKRDEYDEEAEDEFNREFAKMLADTTEVRRDVRKAAPVFDQAVPMIRRAQQSDDHAETTPSDGKHMQFSLLVVDVNSSVLLLQVRTLEIPVDSAIAINTRSQQLQNKQEQEQLKRLVLQNERRLEQSEQAALEQSIRNRFMPRRHADG
ncbi:hypothetical protein QFC21_001048 [Naganishia friedmannii]|uniref:Uncharacterized protein n=1 Tax=Naganishia friedmannii TaxID=89922 RepID=A0ACC2W763_9TREE|nr:hypothetical protein QFC21_001048 [Naganishia friedmannii]